MDNNSSVSKISVITTSAIKLLIFTGARRSEIAGIRWSELNLETKKWLLPSERTKNRQGHVIYLSELSIEVINALKPISGNSAFVFDTGRYLDGGIFMRIL